MSEKFEYGKDSLSEEEKRMVTKIRDEYTQDKRSGLKRLQEIKRKQKRSVLLPTVTTVILGILVFGTGFSIVLEFELLIWGSLVAGLGILILVLCYYLHGFLDKKYREKYRDEVLRITNEILEEKTKD